MTPKDIALIKKTFPRKIKVEHREHGVGEVVDIYDRIDGFTNIDVWFDDQPKATSFTAEKAWMVIYQED